VTGLTQSEEDTNHELDLRRIANARMVRRVASFVATGVGAAILARYSSEIAHWSRVLAESETGMQVQEGMLFEFGFAVFALLLLLHLLYALGMMVWQWRTFVPMLESKRPEEVAVALVRLTSIFATSQRTAQSRQLVGAAAVVVGLVKLAQGSPWEPSLIEAATVPVGLIAMGASMMFVSFWLRYGFSYSRTVVVPLLEAVVGAEESRLDEATIKNKVTEIVARLRKQKPWWFIRPIWFL
jgi:hypothetical protein